MTVRIRYIAPPLKNLSFGKRRFNNAVVRNVLDYNRISPYDTVPSDSDVTNNNCIRVNSDAFTDSGVAFFFFVPRFLVIFRLQALRNQTHPLI